MEETYTLNKLFREISNEEDAIRFFQNYKIRKLDGGVTKEAAEAAFGEEQIEIIENEQLRHFTVNHKYNFFDPVTLQHTQTIERLWGSVKWGNKKRRGTNRNYLKSYLAEFMWKKKCQDQCYFKSMLYDIAAFPTNMINLILRQNEVKKFYGPGTAVKSLYANQIGSHVPIQDMWGEATGVYSRDIMLGVFDGNTGIACSHVVAKRLFKYLTLSLLPQEVLKGVVESASNRFRHVQVMRSLQDSYFFLEEYRKVYQASEEAFAKDLFSRGKELDVQDALIHSFQRLDEDLSREALEDSTLNKRLLWVGMTGTGATLAHISGLEVTIGTAGDALVVVGSKSGEAKVLTPEHNGHNRDEVAKVLREHPDEPGVLDKGLLLGSLTSFRSFGNFRYKWSQDKVKERFLPVFGDSALASNCLSPPYLTAMPDISHYTLSSDDSFMVIASDGIWDIFPPKRVVEIVSKHKPVHWAKQKLITPWKKIQDLRSILKNENLKEELDMEDSPATQIILEALVATSKNLHLPKRFIRNIRDDMTVLVLYFDQEYLKSHLNVKEKKPKIKLPKPLMKIIPKHLSI